MAQKAIIIQTAFVGDLLLTIPLMRRLRGLYTQGEIHLVCRKNFGDFFLKTGLIDKAFEIDKSSTVKKKESLFNIYNSLSKNKYDLLISPHQSLSSTILTTKIHARKKVGYKRFWNGLFYDKRYGRQIKLPEVFRQLLLLTDIDENLDFHLKKTLSIHSAKEFNEVGGDFQIPDWASMTLVNSGQKGKAKEKIIFLAPGSVWPTKRWSQKGYIRLAKMLLVAGYYVKIVGAPSEVELCKSIYNSITIELLEKNLKDMIENICGKTSLYEMYELFQQGAGLVANDSGAMHLAAVAGLPVVSVFGPTVLEFGYRPWLDQSIVISKDLSCRPCGKHGAKKCPLGTHECMKSIMAKEVFLKLEDLLGKENI